MLCCAAVVLLLCVQDYLTQRCENQTLLVVSHDRSFLNAVCEQTIEMRDKQLRYGGGPGLSCMGQLSKVAASEQMLLF
jgi:ATPase subunit of ABC transporter with duplicated ATPase domains